jgi:hypothetical protein
MSTTARKNNRVVDCFAGNTAVVPDELFILGIDPILHDQELDEHKDHLFVDRGDLGVFSIMSQPDGDKRVVWCSKLIGQVKAAKKLFLDLVKQGMVPYWFGS